MLPAECVDTVLSFALLFSVLWGNVSQLNELEMDGGDGGITKWMHLMSLNPTLKNGENGKFYVVCILPQ